MRRSWPILVLAVAACSSGEAGDPCEIDRECVRGFYCTSAKRCWYDCRLNEDCAASYACDARGRCREAIDGGPVDGGAPVADGGPDDGGALDAGIVDGGPRDAGAADGGARDAGLRDAGRRDAGLRDAGRRDAGGVDAGSITCRIVAEPVTGSAGVPVLFRSGVGESTPPLRYGWTIDLGPGGRVTGSAETITVRFNAPAVYLIQLRVEDAAGRTCNVSMAYRVT